MVEYYVPKSEIKTALLTYLTPFHIYSADVMRRTTASLYDAMQQAGFQDFKNYYAVKALPNPHVLRVLKEAGHGFDCSSIAELRLSEKVGASGDEICFTSNNTSSEEFAEALRLEAIINFDDPSLIERCLKIGVPHTACCRLNPGAAVVSDESNMLRGTPVEQKYGMGEEALVEAYKSLKDAGVKQFGIHTMLLSNNLDYQSHVSSAHQLFSTAARIAQKAGITFSFINLGGGIGVAYKPDDMPFDLMAFGAELRKAYDASRLQEFGAPRIAMENGRMVTAEAGWLVTNVRTIKKSYKYYVGVDASMADLMRPGMYGAYHHIDALDPRPDAKSRTVDVVGSLCENNDKFAIDRPLMECEVGDTLVVHTTGAHGHAMGFNYNGRLRHAELLIDDGDIRMIRRNETLDDLFATIVPLGDTEENT